MKTILLISALLSSTFSSVYAQITTSITTKTRDQTFSMGREFWFAAPSNQWGASSEYVYPIEITSTVNTTAYVEFGGLQNIVKVNPYQVSYFFVPQAWEMESSCIVENKGIHVYSNDAELSVCFMSHQADLSEATNLIPTIGWGTDYVVAAFASLFEGSGTYVYDYPSECVIVSEEDNTSVEITPSCDCRECTTGNENANPDAYPVAFPAGKTFFVTINRGQSLELMPVDATGPDNFDMTGTVIHANNPVGVIGGSSETNIPLDYAYSGFVCEMIPPTRTWGETYFTTNFTLPSGAASEDALYLFVASRPGQTINHTDCATGTNVVCQISNQYGFYWTEISGAQKFTSSAPFLVISYMNNPGYNGEPDAPGGPAEVVINPREQYTKSELFQVQDLPSQYKWGFVNYANIILNDSDEKQTLFDGKPIDGNPKQCIDGDWEVFFLPNIAAGTHTIMGDDSGVGVYVYGNWNSSSYAWSSPDFEGTYQSPDSLAPLAKVSVNCYQATTRISNVGNLPNGLGVQSGLAAIRLDSLSNMTYLPDPDFTEGIVADTSGYTTFPVDLTQPGFLLATAFDFAGNSTTVSTIYTPNVIAVQPPLHNLGTWISGSPKIAYDTIVNEGQSTFTISELQLKYGDVGFSLFDSIGGPLDFSPLAPGQRRLIQLQFQAVKAAAVVDSIICGNACYLQTVAVIGSGGANDFMVTGQTWAGVAYNPANPTCYPKMVEIENLSDVLITIDSAWWADTIHFKAISTFPITLPPSPGSVPFTIEYCPDSNSAITPNRTQGVWFSPNVVEFGSQSPRFDSLVGWALAPAGVNVENVPSLEAVILPMNDGRTLEIVLPPDLNGSIHFELFNVLGESVLRATCSPGTQNVDASSLPRGVYFYRLTAGQTSQSGKLMLGE